MKSDLVIITKIPGRALSAVMPDPGGLDTKTVKYVVADACVALADCTHCGAPIGSLCRGSQGHPTLSCHIARHMAARAPKRQLRAAGKLQGAWRIIFQTDKRRTQSRSRRRRSPRSRR